MKKLLLLSAVALSWLLMVVPVSMAKSVKIRFSHVVSENTPEITIMALIWCTFIGASLGVKENIHIGVDVLVNRFGPKTRRALVVISIALCLLFGVIVAVKGFAFARFISRSHLLSRDLRIPMEIGYLAVPVGGALISLRFIERLVHVLKGESFEIDRMHELTGDEKDKLAKAPDK